MVPDAVGDLALPPRQAQRPGRSGPVRLRRRPATQTLTPAVKDDGFLRGELLDRRQAPVARTRFITPASRPANGQYERSIRPRLGHFEYRVGREYVDRPIGADCRNGGERGDR